MDSPKIYVASLSDYNNGRLEGRWFDFSDYSNASDLMEGIQEMLDELNQKYNDGEIREEWAVHDYEYIPSSLASEYMGEKDFEEIYNIMEVAENIGIPMEVLMERVSDTGNDDLRSVADSLMFVVDGNDESDIVYELEEQIGDLGFDFWQNHIYIDDVTKRVMYSEDVDRYRDDILSDNPDLDEDEVERMAEEQADEEESNRDNDLIGYLKEMGYEDIPSYVSKDYESAWNSALSYDYDVINHDGEMYVFSNSYAQGGRTMEVSEYDLARIKQAVKEARMEENKGKFNPSDVQQFIKDNPQLLMMLKKGGKIDNDENYEMLKSKVKELMHHSKELETIIKTKQETPAWVVAKSTRASTDLSDITHYMDGKKFAKGGGIRKMKLYDAVLYNGKQYDISKKNGIVGLKNLSQGAWGSDYPFIPLYKVDINNVTDMYGNKVEISEIYENGGGVDEYINIDKMNPNQYEIVTNFNTLKSLAKNGFIELHEKTGLRYKNYESKDPFRTNRVTNVRHDYIKSAKQPKFKFNNRDYAIGYVKGLNFLNLYVLKDISENKYENGGGVKNIYIHKYNPNITLEFIENTTKGIKGLQKNPKSLSKKERNEGIIVNYSDSEIKELFNKKYANGGGVGFREEQINDLNSWDNDEIANFLGVSSSQVAKDRQRYIREAQSVMMLDSYAKGGMTEHGLEIGDEIMGYTKKVNELHVINRKNDEWHSVDLDDGKRYEDGGNINGLSDLIYG
jgi:antirestriction protein